MSVKFDRDFEDAIVSEALKHDDFLKQAIRICDVHHFGTREQSWIWGVISKSWLTYKERATPKLILHKAREDFPDDEKRKPYLKLAQRLFKLKGKAPRSALDHLEKFVRHVNVQVSLEASADALERGDIDAAEEAQRKATRSRVKVRDYTHIDWYAEFDDRQSQRRYEKEHPDDFKVIPTGWPTFDRALSGGARIGELGLVVGTTGRGKSVILNNMGQACVAAPKLKACYFSLEMPARQVAMRQDSRWLQLPYTQFKNYEFSPSELRGIEKHKKRSRKQLSNKFHILSMPVRSADINTLRSALEDLREDFDFKPDLILVDSGDHMLALDRRQDFRLQQSEVYWELKKLAEEDGYAIWSSAQAGKEYATTTATAEAVSESYDKARIADTVISINDPNARKRGRRTVEIDDIDDDGEEIKEPEAGVPGVRNMEGFLAKYRDGTSNIKVKLAADFERMTIREVEEDDD